jgi:hypothetical protein
MDHPVMIEVRRPTDDELCGFVVAVDGGWHALTLFHGVLGAHESRADAEHTVRELGLASLARRWQFIDHEARSDDVVCIQEAWPGRVTIVLDPYGMPGAPKRTLTSAELATGTIELRLV